MTKEILEKVAEAYDPGGFIYKLRYGRTFDNELADQFIADVNEITLDSSDQVPIELAKLAWHIPVMLQYQRDWFEPDTKMYNDIHIVMAAVIGHFEDIIGVP